MKNLICCALVVAGLCLGQYAVAQEDLFNPDGVNTSNILPPPIAGAWAGSAAANILMEDGAFISNRRSPWSLSLFNWANVNMKDYRQGAGRLETYNYASFDYRLNWESKVSIRPEFYISGSGRDFFGNDVEGESEMGDIYVQYLHNSLGLLSTPIGDVGMSGSARVYLPNNKYAKMQRQITRLQARMMFQMPLRWGMWMTYHFRPMYFVQSQKAYLNEYYNAKANEHYRLEQWLELSKPIGRSLAVSQMFGVEHRHYYDSVPNNITSERTDGFVSLSTSLAYFLGSVSFRGGLNYESKIARPDRNPQVYNEAETTYFLMTNVRL